MQDSLFDFLHSDHQGRIRVGAYDGGCLSNMADIDKNPEVNGFWGCVPAQYHCVRKPSEAVVELASGSLTGSILKSGCHFTVLLSQAQTCDTVCIHGGFCS